MENVVAFIVSLLVFVAIAQLETNLVHVPLVDELQKLRMHCVLLFIILSTSTLTNWTELQGLQKLFYILSVRDIEGQPARFWLGHQELLSPVIERRFHETIHIVLHAIGHSV